MQQLSVELTEDQIDDIVIKSLSNTIETIFECMYNDGDFDNEGS